MSAIHKTCSSNLAFSNVVVRIIRMFSVYDTLSKHMIMTLRRLTVFRKENMVL